MMGCDNCLCLLIKAVENVKSEYIYVDSIPDTRIKKIQTERSFAYELYHQWSKLLEDTNNPCCQDPDCRKLVQLNGEISKEIDFRKVSFPDMVLHGGQNDFSRQKIVCEIKRKDKRYPYNQKIIKDLKKLYEYLQLEKYSGHEEEKAKHIGYENAVFIMANYDNQQLKNTVKSIYQDNFTDEDREKFSIVSGRLHFISVEVVKDEDNTKVESFKLKDIIKLSTD